ncbi:MAG: nucleotidyltransferase family protein [Patescibacteria group bacterium]
MITVEEVRKKAAPVFEQYGIEYAGIFGSLARNQGNDTSDVDVLVRLGSPMGLFLYMRFIHELENILNKKVDVVTEQSLNKFVKPYVMEDLKTIYEKR